MQNINLESFRHDVKSVFQRFSICIIFGTLFYVSMILYDTTRFQSETSLLLFGLGTMLSYVLHLFSEEFDHPLSNPKIATTWAATFSALIAFVIYLEVNYHNIRWPQSIRLAIVAICLFLVVGTLIFPFFREKDDTKIWHFSCRLLISAGIALLVGLMAFFCTIFLYNGTLLLFDIKPHDSTFIKIIEITSGVYLPFLIFLLRTPAGEKKHDLTREPNKFVTALSHYLLLPFMFLYFVVAYIYEVVILFNFELPQGTIVWVVSILMVLLFALYLLLYPNLQQKPEGLDAKILKKSAALSIPLLLLMSISIFVRVRQYGITPERLYVITLNIWFYVIAILLATNKMKRVSKILLSAAIIILLTTAQPLNFIEITRLSISHRIAAVAEENHFDAKAIKYPYKWWRNLPDETRAALTSDMKYIRDNYSDKALFEALYGDEAYDPQKFKFLNDY